MCNFPCYNNTTSTHVCDKCGRWFCSTCLVVLGCNGQFCVKCSPASQKIGGMDFAEWMHKKLRVKQNFSSLYLAFAQERTVDTKFEKYKHRPEGTCTCEAARILVSLQFSKQ